MVSKPNGKNKAAALIADAERMAAEFLGFGQVNTAPRLAFQA